MTKHDVQLISGSLISIRFFVGHLLFSISFNGLRLNVTIQLSCKVQRCLLSCTLAFVLHPLLYVYDAMVRIHVCFTGSHVSIVSYGIHWRTYFIKLHFFFSALQVPHSTFQPPPTLTPTNSIPFLSCPRCFPLRVCRSQPLARYWCQL